MPARHNVKGRSKGGASYVQLFHYLLRSQAWLSLTPAARCVYIEVAALYNGRNNGWLALSVRDAGARCRVNKDTAGKVFYELVQTGFLEKAAEGSFSYKINHATEWRLTAFKCDRTASEPSKAFVKYAPAPDVTGKPRSGNRGHAVPSRGSRTLRLVVGGPSLSDL